MGNLSQNWITENHIDFEYKKYVLLAYLSEVSTNFECNKLYPYLAQVIEHYKSALVVKENKKLLNDFFPSKIAGIDAKNLNLEYKKIILDDQLMEEIDQIVNYSLEKFEFYLKEGKKIYDFIEEHLHLAPVGIVPLNCDFGYFFLQNGKSSETRIYEYKITVFENADEKYRGIHSLFIDKFENKLTHSFENIKATLIKTNRHLPNPATYSIQSEFDLPLDETLLPIAKRTLVKYLSRKAA
jgi:hypothetical protein